MTSIITPTPSKPVPVAPHLHEFIETLNPPSDSIRQALYQYRNVVEKLIDELKTPLPDEIPNDIKVFHNGKLQKWFIFQPEFPRYFVEKVPNFEKVPFEDQVYVHYYFDGILARFGVYQQILIERITPENRLKIQEILKV